MKTTRSPRRDRITPQQAKQQLAALKQAREQDLIAHAQRRAQGADTEPRIGEPLESRSFLAEMEELIRFACEPVPLRSGIEKFGFGPFHYMKMALDGSARVFAFPTKALADEALKRSCAAEAPARASSRFAA